jgi:GAF domain-containing protein
MAAGTHALHADLLRRVLDNQSVGVALFEPIDSVDFITVYANGVFQSLKPHVPMIGRKFTETWPETAHLFVPSMMRVLETGEAWIAENRELELEREPGRLSKGYFTFTVARIESEGERYVVSEVQETTAGVEAQQRASRDLETTRMLLDASRTLSECVELQHVLNKLAEVLLSSTSHTRSFVFLWDEERRQLTRAASAGVSAFPEGQVFLFDDVSEVTKQVILTRLTAVVDFDALPEAQRGRALAAQQSHVLVVVPVVWRDRLVGLIGVDDPGERREFALREIEIVEGIAAQAASAIENARLFEEGAENLRGLAQRDSAIRQAYSDVIDAVTGGRLILLGTDELDEVLAERTGDVHEIRDPAELGEARRVVREEIGDAPWADDFALAFSEGVTNMLKHAGGGEYWVGKDESRVQLGLSDSGTGIDFRDLPKATLVSGFSTKQTLGLGFTLMMELTDRLLLCTDSGGTTLVLERDLAPADR